MWEVNWIHVMYRSNIQIFTSTGLLRALIIGMGKKKKKNSLNND